MHAREQELAQSKQALSFLGTLDAIVKRLRKSGLRPTPAAQKRKAVAETPQQQPAAATEPLNKRSKSDGSQEQEEVEVAVVAEAGGGAGKQAPTTPGLGSQAEKRKHHARPAPRTKDKRRVGASGQGEAEVIDLTGDD